MRLAQRGSTKKIVYKGPGTLRQLSPGQLSFKLYSTLKADFMWDNGLEAGEILPEESYFDLNVTDERGRKWVSERILVEDPHIGVQRKAVVDNPLDEISCKYRLRKSAAAPRSSLSMAAFQKIDIPANTHSTKRESVARGRRKLRWMKSNAWKFRCLKFDFLAVQEENDLFTLTVRSEDSLFPEHFGERVMEILQFLFGMPVAWEFLRFKRGPTIETILRSRHPQRPKARFMSPIAQSWFSEPGSNRATTKYHRRLFERYLRHIIEYNKQRHPLWGQLNELYEASSGRFIDGYALALVVAIEAFVEREFPNLGKLTSRQELQLKDAKKHMKEWAGNEELKNRIEGSISQLHCSRAGDKLRALVKSGAITKEQMVTWTTLRNALVHGATPKNDAFADLLYRAKVLFYHLVFHAIGYKGYYTDYSTKGWPLKWYPNR